MHQYVHWVDCPQCGGLSPLRPDCSRCYGTGKIQVWTEPKAGGGRATKSAPVTPRIAEGDRSSIGDDLAAYNRDVELRNSLLSKYRLADDACAEAADRVNALGNNSGASSDELDEADLADEQSILARESVVVELLEAEHRMRMALLAMLEKAHVLAPTTGPVDDP